MSRKADDEITDVMVRRALHVLRESGRFEELSDAPDEYLMRQILRSAFLRRGNAASKGS